MIGFTFDLTFTTQKCERSISATARLNQDTFFPSSSFAWLLTEDQLTMTSDHMVFGFILLGTCTVLVSSNHSRVKAWFDRQTFNNLEKAPTCRILTTFSTSFKQERI